MTTAARGSLEQRRARHAWEAVRASAGKRGQFEDYAREAKRLPVRIMTSGLGASLAFLNAKGKAAPADDVARWILDERGLASRHGARGQTNTKDLIGEIVLGDSDFLRQVTEEAMRYLEWLTRFAEAESRSTNGG